MTIPERFGYVVLKKRDFNWLAQDLKNSQLRLKNQENTIIKLQEEARKDAEAFAKQVEDLEETIRVWKSRLDTADSLIADQSKKYVELKDTFQRSETHSRYWTYALYAVIFGVSLLANYWRVS